MLAQLVSGCSGASPAPKPVSGSAQGSSAQGSSAQGLVRSTQPSIKRWRYHPRTAQRLTASSYIPEKGTLSIGQYGERWLTHPGSTGFSLAATTLAPERLEGVFWGPNDHWVFVGQQGTTYWSTSPLADFSRQFPPPHPMVQTFVSNATILAVGEAQRLWRSNDAGRQWHRVGPPEARFSDLWFENTEVLALQTPEALWWSSNSGSQFTQLPSAPFGVSQLGAHAGADPMAVSLLGSRILLDESPVTWDAAGNSPPPPPQLPQPPALGPSAIAMQSGRAEMWRDHYWEVILKPQPKLLSGTWKQPLNARTLPIVNNCRAVRLTGFGRWLYILCSHGSGSRRGSFELKVFRSANAGRSFEPLSTKLFGDISRLRMAVGAKGLLLVTGVCPERNSKIGCRPSGIHSLQPLPDRIKTPVHWQPVAAPSLAGAALALRFASDGRRFLAIGRRTKNESLYSFTSHSSHRRLSPHKLDVSYSSSLRVQSMTAPSEQTAGAVVLSYAEGQSLVLSLDDEGLPVSQHPGPTAGSTIGVWSHFALAHDHHQLWQSSNFGADWVAISAPRASHCAPEEGACRLAIQCQQAGCVLGDRASRWGWLPAAKTPTEAAPPRAAVPDPPLPPETSPAAVSSYSQTPIQCQLNNEPWHALEGVRRIPRATQAALGQTPLYALAYDYERGSCGTWIFSSELGSRPQYEPLLRAVSSPKDFAMAPSLQVEGAAALRYRVSRSEAPATAEVAWTNFLSNTRAEHQVDIPGQLLPSDYTQSSRGALRARPDLLSISGDGLYLRAHSTGRMLQSTLFINAQGAASSIAAVPWPSALQGGQPEMARVSDKPLHLMFLNKGATIVRATRAEAQWSFDAFTTNNPLLTPHTQQSWDIAYAPTGVGIVQTTRYADDTVAGQFFPLQHNGRVLGEPTAIPTQLALPERPPPCTTQQVRDTPRIIAPAQPGSSRQVSIHAAFTATRRLKTQLAILHGSPQVPCLAAYDAAPAPRSRSITERAIINPEGASWFFRTAPDSTRRNVIIEYRAMNCAWTATPIKKRTNDPVLRP